MAGARLHVKDEALQGEAEVGRQGAQPDLAPRVHLGLAVAAEVLVVALQALGAQQARLRHACTALCTAPCVSSTIHEACMTHATCTHDSS